MPRNTTGRGDAHAPVGEWGSKARKQQAKVKRQTNREAAIREGLNDR